MFFLRGAPVPHQPKQRIVRKASLDGGAAEHNGVAGGELVKQPSPRGRSKVEPKVAQQTEGGQPAHEERHEAEPVVSQFKRQQMKEESLKRITDIEGIGFSGQG